MSAEPLRVRVEREACLGSQSCVRRAPKSFALDADGRARALAEPGDAEDVVLDAARACPAFAIRVERGDETLV